MHAYKNLSDEAIERTAERMGIRTDVLLEARVRTRLKMTAAGVPPPVSVRYKQHNLQLILCFPEVVWEKWVKHVDDWGVDSGALLRSLIQAYLLGSWEPETVNNRWIWEGRHEPVVRSGLCRAKTYVTRGARMALTVRARMLGCSVMAVLRALVIANMNGTFGRRGVLKIIDTRSMFDDETRYFLAK